MRQVESYSRDSIYRRLISLENSQNEELEAFINIFTVLHAFRLKTILKRILFSIFLSDLLPLRVNLFG